MKPVLLTGSWTVHAPLKRVYEIVTDFEKAPHYFPLVASSMKITNRNGNHLSITTVTKTLGMSFRVQMETELIPGKGFRSINTSALATEDESFLMEEMGTGTKITYRNEVQIKNTILQLFARLLIGKPALLFWKYAYIDRLETTAANE